MQTDSSTSSSAEAAEPLSIGDALSSVVDKLGSWLDSAILLLPNVVVAVLIVVAFAFLARLVRRVVQSLMDRVTNHAPQAKNVVSLFSTIAYVVVLAAGTFVALTVLELTGLVATLLAGAGVVGLALGFAFQDIASNFIAGVLMAVRNPFVVGQIIETNGHMGTVREITLRSTLIETFQGQTVIIPNAKVFQEPIVNYNEKRQRRVDLGCGVGYGDDLAKAQTLAVQAIEGLEPRAQDRPVTFHFTEFGDSSVNFEIRFWVDFSSQGDFLSARSEAIKSLKTAFDEGGITIPFPIRTLDFDPNGGVPLTAMLGGQNSAVSA